MKKIHVVNYREKFKRYYDIDIPRDFDVHHIDLNHDNNDISNLMILPKDLHHRYHTAISGLNQKNGFIKLSIKICGNRADLDSYYFNKMTELVDILRECAKWRDFKEQLDLKKLTEEITNKRY